MSFITIKIPQGQLKGKKNLDLYENEYYSFEGIPYAKPPIGNLRFKPPQPADSWEGVFDATVGTKICPSYINTQLHPDLVDEDCLRVNVYTPVDLTHKSDKLLSVMVYIHGGIFVAGSSVRDDIGPDYLMNKDIILVTFNYRVGVLGFFSLDDVSLNITGNAGLKDMIQVLKWIKNNIKYFGGNPYNVTLFGESAGAIAINLLLINHLSRGLYHKVIIQSGVAICPWSFNQDILVKANNYFLKKLECNTTDNTKIFEYLQTKSHSELCEAEYYAFRNAKSHSNELPNFTPIVEVQHETAFIVEHPEESMKNGNFFKCPILIGYINNDGGIHEKLENTISDSIDFRVIPKNILKENDTETLNVICKKLQTFYYKNELPSRSNREIKYKMMTDLHFAIPIKHFIQYMYMHSSYSIYFYKFFLKSNINQVKGELQHADDIRYIFSTKLTKDIVTIGSIEEKRINLITTLWTNFAKLNDPNPLPKDYGTLVWQPITSSKINYLHIDHNPRMCEDPDGNRLKFVQTLFGY